MVNLSSTGCTYLYKLLNSLAIRVFEDHKLFTYRPLDPDWRSRYEIYNRPGEYHNGGVWPFILGFYVAAIVAAGLPHLGLPT
jgi:hypothetical protein